MTRRTKRPDSIREIIDSAVWRAVDAVDCRAAAANEIVEEAISDAVEAIEAAVWRASAEAVARATGRRR